MHGDGTDAFKASNKTEQAQRSNTTRLVKEDRRRCGMAQQGSDGASEEGNVERCAARCRSYGRESACEGRACDACVDDDDVV
jgi:hypothetical protein